MTDPILSLTYFTIVLLIGLLSSIIAKKLKIPNVLLLLLSGIAMNNIYYNGAPLIQFPVTFTTSISILALVMIVFDSTSRLSFREFDTSSVQALKLTGFFMLFNVVLLSIATKYILSTNYLLAMIFATLMAGTAPDVVMTMMEDTKNRILQILKIESIVNTPVVVLFPFIILDFMQSTQIEVAVALEYFKPFLLQIFAGAGVGLIVALTVFKVMRRYYSENLSPLAVISTALLSYILAENLGGNGVLAVTVSGLIFANVVIKKKVALQEFSKLFSMILEILVFVFVGLLIKIPTDPIFIIKSLLLFAIYLMIRYIVVHFSIPKDMANFKERLFMSFNIPKGIAVAVVATLLIGENIAGMAPILDLTLLFMIYSIVLSTIMLKFSKFFLRTNVIK